MPYNRISHTEPIIVHPFSFPTPNVDTARNRASQIQRLDPGTSGILSCDLDLAEMLAEADEGVGGFGEGELLAWMEEEEGEG